MVIVKDTGSIARDAFKDLIPASSTQSSASSTATTIASTATASIGKTAIAAATALPLGAINPVALAASTAKNLADAVARYSNQPQQAPQQQQPADTSWMMALASIGPAISKMLGGDSNENGGNKRTNSNSNNLQQANNSVNNNPGLDKPVKVKAEDSSPTTDSNDKGS